MASLPTLVLLFFCDLLFSLHMVNQLICGQEIFSSFEHIFISLLFSPLWMQLRNPHPHRQEQLHLQFVGSWIKRSPDMASSNTKTPKIQQCNAFLLSCLYTTFYWKKIVVIKLPLAKTYCLQINLRVHLWEHQKWLVSYKTKYNIIHTF